MGKKKQKIKFIDKKNAISFHLVAKADHTEGSDDSESEQQELDRELKAQRDEEMGKPRKRDDDDDEEEDTRINILNLAAAAEGIDTRAERLKKKALKASSSQKTYLQPDRIPGKNDVQIPKDIPAQYLFMGAEGEIDPKEQAYWDASDARKAELERQSRASALLPHNYDYSKHLKPITGRGTFMEAKRGDEMYDPEMDPRDVVVTKSKTAKAKAKAASTAAAASSSSSSSAAPASSLSLHEEESKHGDAEEDDDDMPPLGPSGADGAGDGEEEAPVNPELLASVERLQKKLLKQRHRVRVEKDFVVALEGDQVEQFEELQDDFVMQAMAGAIGAEAGGADDEDGEEAEDGEDEEYEDGEEEDDEDEYEDGEDFEDDEEDDGEERKSSGKTRASMADLYGRRPVRRSADDDDEDEDADEHAGASGHSLDVAFEKLLEDEYSDGEIGGLDDLDPAELDGHLEVEEIERELNEFLDAPSKFKSEGGKVIDKPDAELQDLTLRKLALVAAGEKTLAETEQELHDMKERPGREEQWDAESILSTYTNTENHPRMLKEGASSSRRSKSKASSAFGGSSSGVGPHQIRLAAASRRDVAAFQAPLPIPEAALRAAAAAVDDDDLNVDEEDEEDDDGAASTTTGENKGKARSVLETPDEKKARKAAVKAAQREAKERKKQLKTLYVQETAAAVSKQARLNKANPPGIKKL